jgi:hypothetical protein
MWKAVGFMNANCRVLLARHKYIYVLAYKTNQAEGCHIMWASIYNFS